MGVKERLSLEEATAPTLIACEHRHRYEVASAAVSGLRVLDLCCGSGYGSRILAATAESVHGVDNDARTIDAAAARLSAMSRIGFEAADALEFISRVNVAGRFDAIVCFEGLEHLPHLDAVLARLRELADGGMKMLLSVPNSKGLGEDNVFHVTDFSWEDAQERIGSFPGAVTLTQHLAEGSLIRPADASGQQLEAHAVLEERDEPEYANHYIFVIGFEPPPVDSRMHLEVAPLANRYMRSLEEANRELRRANQRLARDRLGRADSAAGAYAAKQSDAVHRAAELDERVAYLEPELAAWIDRCHGAEAREALLREELTRARQSRPTRTLLSLLRRRGSG